MKSITSIILSLWACACFGEPKIVASIRPLAMIAEVIVEQEGGAIGVAEVLLPPSVAHHYSLTVSDRRQIHQADWFIWVGKSLEGFLSGVVDQRKTPVITVSGLNLLWPLGKSVEYGSGNHGESHSKHGHEEHEEHKPSPIKGAVHEHGDQDPHVWLNPMNVVIIAQVIADQMSAKYPDNAAKYQENSAKINKRMLALDKSIRHQLAPVSDKPFIVYHPAYGHFVEHFGLNQQGSIVYTAEQPVSAKRLIALGKQPAVCVLGEVGQPMTTVNRLATALNARVGTLDPLGQQGQGSIDQLIQTIADELLQCLSGKS